MKKLILGLIVLAMSVPTIASATSTQIDGSIKPTLIQVSVPSKIAFSIDGNDKIAPFKSSSIKMINETNASISVKLEPIKESFGLSSTSEWKPSDVMPNSKNWSELGKNESSKYLALGVKVGNGDWLKINKNDAQYVADISTKQGQIYFGDIKRGGTAYMDLICNHGNSFDNFMQCSYNIIWTFSLAE